MSAGREETMLSTKLSVWLASLLCKSLGPEIGAHDSASAACSDLPGTWMML